MKQLPDLPLEQKALATATLIFAGISVLMGFAYIVASHQGSESSYWINTADIAAFYTGPGVGTETLISLAHVHLLGLLSVFAIIGFIFVHSTLPAGWRAFLAVLPFAAFLIDVSGWFLTNFAGAAFVYLVIAGGATFIMALGAMILISLYDIWFGRRSS